MNLRRRSAFILLVATLASCRNSTGPNQLDGSYLLESVNGRGPSTGVIVFFPGQVMRSVRYVQSVGSLSSEQVAVGGYRLVGPSNVQLNLRENGGNSSYVWTVNGIIADGAIALTYPDGADGWVTESYRRK